MLQNATQSSFVTLSEATQLNPKAAKFIAGGLLLFFGAAQVTSLFSDINTAVTVAIILLGFCCAIPLFQHIIKNPKQRAVLSWACIAVMIGLMGGYVNSALFRWGNPPEPKCYFRIITAQISRQACEAEFITTTATIGAQDAGLRNDLMPALMPAGPEKIWRAQAVVQVADYSADNPYTAGLIYLQFSKRVDRSAAIQLAQALDAAGWHVEGGDKGGEKVDDAPPDNEVRFFHKADEAAAMALARSVYALSPGAPIQVKNFTKLGRVSGYGNLEIWMNTITPPGTEG